MTVAFFAVHGLCDGQGFSFAAGFVNFGWLIVFQLNDEMSSRCGFESLFWRFEFQGDGLADAGLS